MRIQDHTTGDRKKPEQIPRAGIKPVNVMCNDDMKIQDLEGVQEKCLPYEDQHLKKSNYHGNYGHNLRCYIQQQKNIKLLTVDSWIFAKNVIPNDSIGHRTSHL